MDLEKIIKESIKEVVGKDLQGEEEIKRLCESLKESTEQVGPDLDDLTTELDFLLDEYRNTEGYEYKADEYEKSMYIPLDKAIKVLGDLYELIEDELADLNNPAFRDKEEE